MTLDAAALQGTVHLSKMPRITLTCKALDLDYAVAMVGFEVRGGMSVPCFDGVIVCEEHAEAIKEAYYAAERYNTLLFLLSHLTSGSLTAGLAIDARLHVLHEARCKVPAPRSTHSAPVLGHESSEVVRLRLCSNAAAGYLCTVFRNASC